MEPGRPGVEPEARLTPLRKAHSESLITEWRLWPTQITFLVRRAAPCGPVPSRCCALELFANIKNDNKRRVKASTAQQDLGRPSLPSTPRSCSYPSQARSPRVREVPSPAQLSPSGNLGGTVQGPSTGSSLSFCVFLSRSKLEGRGLTWPLSVSPQDLGTATGRWRVQKCKSN